MISTLIKDFSQLFILNLQSNNLENTYAFSPANKVVNKTKELGKKGQRRPIVIDGCNVAFHHGRHDMFSGE